MFDTFNLMCPTCIYFFNKAR